jgi:hypothetical protein
VSRLPGQTAPGIGTLILVVKEMKIKVTGLSPKMID